MDNWTPDKLTEQIESGSPVFLKLWKKGCGACKLSEPAIERIQAADGRGIAFGQINVDDFPEMFEITEVDLVPAFFVFVEKQMKAQFVGFKGLAKLQEMVNGAFA